MNREECEAKILEKLKEIREIVKEYDDSHKGALDIAISNEDDYIAVFNSSSVVGNLNTTIDFTTIDGEVWHFGN